MQTSLIDAPVNSAAEYPVAAAAAAMAVWIEDDPERTIRQLAHAAHDARWRTRETVTLGVQRIARTSPEPVIALIQQWGTSTDPWLERAALVTLADAHVLRHAGSARLGLDLIDGILGRLQGLPQALQKTEGNRVLAKALGFTISMFVAAAPEDGFPILERWLMQADGSTRRIINENLGKARLTRKYSTDVARLKNIEFEINDWDRH